MNVGEGVYQMKGSRVPEYFGALRISYQFSPSQGLLQAIGVVSVIGCVVLAGFGSAVPLRDSSDAAIATASTPTRHKHHTILVLSLGYSGYYCYILAQQLYFIGQRCLPPILWSAAPY